MMRTADHLRPGIERAVSTLEDTSGLRGRRPLEQAATRAIDADQRAQAGVNSQIGGMGQEDDIQQGAQKRIAQRLRQDPSQVRIADALRQAR